MGYQDLVATSTTWALSAVSATFNGLFTVVQTVIPFLIPIAILGLMMGWAFRIFRHRHI